MVSTATVLSLNWIHLKRISGVTFCIIGLTKIPKIEFLPLNWIYHSIRIITVRVVFDSKELILFIGFYKFSLYATANLYTNKCPFLCMHVPSILTALWFGGVLPCNHQAFPFL